MAYDCLNNIIGLSRTDCDCVIDDIKGDGEDTGNKLPADWYKESTSGLYLDELEGIVPIRAATTSSACERDMAKFYYQAIQSATQTTINELLIAITQRGVNGFRSYSGKIANNKGGTVQTLTGIGYAGMKLKTHAMRGGNIVIKQITAIIDTDATFDIKVYRKERYAEDMEEIGTIPGIVGSPAGTLNTLGNPFIIYLSEFGADFYLLYEPNGFNPKQNSISCGCGSREQLLKQYLTVNGVIAHSLDDNFSNYSNAMGLSLIADVGCDTTSIICTAFGEDEAFTKVLPYAIRYKAGELVQEFVAGSGDINQYTVVSKEHIYGKRNHFKAEYNTRITWMAENINLALIDCYKCNDKRITKGGIRV